MPRTPHSPARGQKYWRAVLRRTLLLLTVWFLAGPLLGILFVDALNGITIRGVPFGFWIAQQGAIYVFVALIFLYAWLAERSDRGEQRSDSVVSPEPERG